MKKTMFPFILIAFFVFIPMIALSHMEGSVPADAEDIKSGGEMMQYIENKVLGGELHEEMESLMLKMMGGSMDEGEADRMVELMRKYPAVQGMMMNRMMGSAFSGRRFVFGGSGGMGAEMFPFSFSGGGLMVLSGLIWFIAGIFATVWLWKKISAK